MRRRDLASAEVLEQWLQRLALSMAGRILPVTPAIFDRWGRMGVADPVPVVDGLLAATAITHNLILATRNVDDVKDTGADVFNPFGVLQRILPKR